MRRTKGKLMDSGARTRHLGTRRSHLNMGPTPIKHYFCNFARARNPTVWGRCQCCRGRGLGQMVLLTDRGPSGYLPDVWASLKAAAAANPDVPTGHRPASVLVALDVDALLRRGFGGEGGKQRSLPAEHTGLWPINITKSRVRTPYTVHVTRVYTWNAPPLGDSARLAPARARLSSASTVSVVAAHRPAQGSQPSML